MTNYQQWTTTALILLVLANDTEAYSRDDSFIGYSETIISHPRVAAQGQEYLIFATAYGDITVRLLIHEAPQTVNHMKHLVEKGLFEGCAFYRVEPATETHDTGYTGSRKGGLASFSLTWKITLSGMEALLRGVRLQMREVGKCLTH
eukprot:c23039_g1_i1 orf=611-1051(-)